MTTDADVRRGKLVFEDGTCYEGRLRAAGELPVCGEVVFNTSMTGYQEVITDPSYAGQIVVMTYPQIGNYGANPDDSEAPRCAARALVVRELSEYFSPGPGRVSLESFMSDAGLPGLAGIDTRAVTRYIRSRGAVVAAIGGAEHDREELVEMAKRHSFSRGESLVEAVSGTRTGLVSRGGRGRVGVIDLGVKRSIVDSVSAIGAAVEVIGAGFSAGGVLAGGYDFVVVSNGPGDPRDIPGVVAGLRELLGKVPLFGVCLGHQVIALALGATTYKLPFGHHGANHPVVDRRTGRVLITSQNHGYTVSADVENQPGVRITFTNAGDGTVEGFEDEERLIECVQFHPEASPGPHDASSLIRDFHDRTKGRRNARCA